MTYFEEELIIEPGRGLKNYWLDLWRYRELFYFLAWRDIAVRYKQTVIGHNGAGKNTMFLIKGADDE